MNYHDKRWDRNGSVFSSPRSEFDLTHVRLLHTGVDTVKELFTCMLRQDVLENIKDCYEADFDRVISVGGYDFIISKSGKVAGYKWILRNSDLGIVVLLRSFYVEQELHGSHMKIEGSPHLIASMTPEDYSALTLKIGGLFATQIHNKACAAHLCVDIKNWAPSEDFEYKLVTRSKRKMRFNSKSEVKFDLNEVSAVYGNRETYTFGATTSIQMCVYDKVTEAIKSDKIAYWENQWRKIPSAEDLLKKEYEHGDRVTRIEFRLHHTVINEFTHGTVDENGENIKITNFAELSDHLTALWNYSLKNFRLIHSTAYIDPLWQLLEEDVQFFKPSPDFVYKRGKKPPSANSRRKTAIWLGNLCRLYSRKRIKVDFVVKQIISSGLTEELLDYFGLFGWEGREVLYDVVHDFVTKKNQKLLLEGIAA